jgi:hypothetical protein
MELIRSRQAVIIRVSQARFFITKKGLIFTLYSSGDRQMSLQTTISWFWHSMKPESCGILELLFFRHWCRGIRTRLKFSHTVDIGIDNGLDIIQLVVS